MDNAPSVSAVSSSRDNLGCSLSQLDDDRRIDAGGMVFHRKKAVSAPREPVSTPATSRGYLLGLVACRRPSPPHFSRASFERARFFGERRLSAHVPGPLSGGTCRFVRFRSSGNRPVCDRAPGLYADLAGVSELQAFGEAPDPVLGGLMGALFAPTGNELERSALFVDQLSLAIGIHVTHHYGNAERQTVTARVKGRRLSIRSMAAVQDMMRDRLDGDIAIEDLARAFATFRKAHFCGPSERRWARRRISS